MTAREEVLARRISADGKTVLLWSDGMLTGATGWRLRGGGGRARNARDRQKNVEAGWLAIGDVELYDYAEVARLVDAARKAVRSKHRDPIIYMRRYFAGDRYRPINRHRSAFAWKGRRR